MKCVRREAGAHRPAASTPSRTPSSRPAPPRDRARPDTRGGRARLYLLLPVLALLLGALGLFAPAPAQAQVTIWSATLTVDIRTGGVATGCSAAPGHTACSTALTDDDFTYKGTNYAVKRLYYNATGTYRLYFNFGNLGGREIKRRLGSLTLNLDGRQFAIRDLPDTGGLAYWEGFNPGWTDGQTVKVSLTEGPVTAHGITVSRFRATPHDDRVDLSWRVDHSGFRGQPKYVIWWREAGSTGWNIYTLQSYYTLMRTTIAPREFMTTNGCWCADSSAK